MQTPFFHVERFGEPVRCIQAPNELQARAIYCRLFGGLPHDLEVEQL